MALLLCVTTLLNPVAQVLHIREKVEGFVTPVGAQRLGLAPHSGMPAGTCLDRLYVQHPGGNARQVPTSLSDGGTEYVFSDQKAPFSSSIIILCNHTGPMPANRTQKVLGPGLGIPTGICRIAFNLTKQLLRLGEFTTFLILL